MADDKEQRRKNLKVIQFDKDKNTLVESERPKKTFADVGGLEDVKKKIRMNFILPLQQPDFFKAFGKQAGGSMLLYGPPGCGKTFLARAVAGEIDAHFIHLELQAVLSMYVGESEHNLHDVFEKAREQRPCVLFIDELDALGGSRHQMRQHHERMMVNQLLMELDGLQSFNDQVYVIGATNTPWYLDPALRRPGRFNNLLFVSPPAKEERTRILELKLSNLPQKELNLVRIAEQSDQFSGADLEQLVREASEGALERTLETGAVQPITEDDFKRALKGRKPTTLEWFATAKNYATFSDVNQDYQVVLDYMKANRIK
jgi:cell division protease FtsH